jgi:hypothetical protein
MKKVWIIEVADKVTGEFSPIPGAGFPTRKEAREVKTVMDTRNDIERKFEMLLVVGHPIPRKTVDVWVILAPYLRHGVTKATATTEEEGKRILHEYWKAGFGAYRMEKRRIKK